jgi:hypothetical protein
MNSQHGTQPDEIAASFLAFARGLILKLRKWEKDAGPPLYDDLEVRFVEEGRKGDIVKRLDYERFFRRRWDSSLAEIRGLARECIRLHLEAGILKLPSPEEGKGPAATAPSSDETPTSLIWTVARPVLATIDKLQTLEAPDTELVDTYRRFVEGWRMADVPQVATVPLLNFEAEASFTITPYFELAPFTPGDKNLLFSRTAAFGDHREPDHRARFKLTGQFSSDTKKPIHFGTVLTETWLAVMAMRLLKAGDVGVRMIYYRSALEHEEFTGGSGQHFHVREFTRDVYRLTAEEGPALLSLIAQLRTAQASGALRSLDVGLGRLNQSYSRQSGEDRIIDMTIALESSLLADVSEELKYRLALRGASLLRMVRKPQEVHALLLAIYDARSQIVHEGKPLHELGKTLKSLGAYFDGFQPQNLAPLCEDVTRQVLKLYLEKLVSGTTIKSVNKTLDSELVESMAVKQE